MAQLVGWSSVAHEAEVGDANVAAVAALIGHPARAAMLDALLDGSARAAGDLAHRADAAPSTASGHLLQLLTGGLVVCETHGLARLARPARVQSLRAADRAPRYERRAPATTTWPAATAAR
jgi:predicted ArsR family transcriptional regulator